MELDEEVAEDESPEVSRHKRDVNWPAYLSAEEQETSYNDHQILRHESGASNMEYMVSGFHKHHISNQSN